MAELPLAGYRVLEFATMIAVPAATHILAGYGAEVIKVEDHQAGDGLRFFGSGKNGLSGWFINANWGKRSIAVDMKDDAGREVVERLIASADVLVEGFRPGVMDRLGFGYDDACRLNPTIVYCSSSGFGATGPHAALPVYDPLIQALSGWAGIQQVDGQPTLVRGMVADKVGAYTNAQAIMAALIGRERSGQGAHVQVNMLESNLNFVWSDVMMDATLLDEDVNRLPNVLLSYRLYTCSDGLVAIAPGADRHWSGMCDALGSQYFEDERFHTAAGRGRYNSEWMDTIEAMVRPFTVQEVVDRLRQADVPVAPVKAPEAVADNEQIESTGMLVVDEHPVAGRVRHPRRVSAFLGDDSRPMPAPRHGEHTSEILSELGFTAEAVSELAAQGVVAAR